MKKIYSLVAMALAAPALFAADDYTPSAPSDVVYLTHRVQSRPLRDADGDKVSGYDGEFAYAINEWGEFRVANPTQGSITLTVTNTYADGHSGNISNSRLSYRILVRHVGQTQEEAEPLIFNAENGYIKWQDGSQKEPLEWLTNSFSDYYDITGSNGVGSEPNLHVIGFYLDPATIEQIGVQSRYTRSKVDYDSAITWVDKTEPDYADTLTWDQWMELQKQYNPTVGVNEVNVETVATEYYDLQGNKLAAGQKGLQIKLTRLSDGSVKATKVIR